MARRKESTVTVRRVNTKEDRKRPSVFLRLKTDETFKGHALFEPDPEVEDNAGYFEYYDHYDKQANQYVPCAGDRCPFCHANDAPSTRALTTWYFPGADVKEQMKVFTANYSTIESLADEAEDEGGLLGKMLRIKRLSDKGDYRVKTLGEKALTKTELKKLLKQVEDMDLPGMVDKQLQIQMERLQAVAALEDDEDDEEEDDDEEEKPKKRGKKIVAEAEEDDDEDEDEDVEDMVGDEDEEEEDEDEEEADDEDEEDEDEEEEPAEISGVYEVVKLNEGEETVDLKNDDGKVKMWFGEDVEWDADEIKKGVNVNVEALQDDEGDWIITEIAVKKTRAKRTTKK